MNNYFKERKTIRDYSDIDVSDDVIYSLLEDAIRAPTTGNMQLYSAILTRDIKKKALLSPAHFNQPSVTGASVIITFCADFNRFIKWCEDNSAIPGYNNFQSFISAFLDTVAFAQQFNTLAEQAGLGCCYLGTTTYNAPEIAKILELPKMVVPVTTITVGYPTMKSLETKQVERLPLEAILHVENYNDYCAKTIAELYSSKENMKENKKYIEENNKETLAQVFTDVRYTKANNEYFSKIYYDFIEQQGFAFPVNTKF
ncbi:MAG: nitroreductase family protein [Muribaculaceae bacterium]